MFDMIINKLKMHPTGIPNFKKITVIPGTCPINKTGLIDWCSQGIGVVYLRLFHMPPKIYLVDVEIWTVTGNHRTATIELYNSLEGT